MRQNRWDEGDIFIPHGSWHLSGRWRRQSPWLSSDPGSRGLSRSQGHAGCASCLAESGHQHTKQCLHSESLLSPSPITQLPPGKQRTKSYCLFTPCFMGKRRWLPGDEVLPWKQPFPWDCISWQKVTARVGDWPERLWKAERGALPLGCSLQNVALAEVSPSTHSTLSPHKQLPQEARLAFQFYTRLRDKSPVNSFT